MVTLTPTPDTVNWLAATVMSALMVAAVMSVLMVASNGNECVDGCRQRVMSELMVDGDG